MQYRIYDRQKIAYIDGGFVRSYTVDDDYIVNNNSKISIIKPTKAQVGDIIALIETSGAFHKGVITNVDNSALEISYKSDKELFNDNFINPLRTSFLEEGVEVAGKFGLNLLALMINNYWGETKDKLKRLPIIVETLGANDEMLWTWSDNSFNFVDFLVELFEKYNVVLNWTINFDLPQEDLAKREPKIIVTLAAVSSKGNLIKDNVAMQKITYSTENVPEATVLQVIDSKTKELIVDEDGNAIYYLAQYSEGKKAGEYYVTRNIDDKDRVRLIKTKIVEYDTSDTKDDKPSLDETATSELVPSRFNQAVEIQINKDSKMFDFETAQFGSEYTIVGDFVKELAEYDSANDLESKDYKIVSNYTGRKQTSENNYVTLYFGLGRQNYTDIIQIRMRKQRYHTIYGQK